jgi:hypothetical protein
MEFPTTDDNGAISSAHGSISFPDVRSAGSTNLWKRLNRTTFLEKFEKVFYCLIIKGHPI